jgi:Major tropism determinant N-terminal domain
MSLRIRRGTDTQRTSIVFDAGELIYTTDTKRLFVGDGITSGGTDPVQNLAGNGLSYNQSTKHLDVVLTPFTTDGLTEGSNNKYFTNQRAQDAFGALVANGTFSGVTVQYDSVNHALNITVAGDYDAVVNDTNPQLGGNLSLNGHNIGGTGNISITGNITANSGTVTAGTFNGTLNGGVNTGTSTHYIQNSALIPLIVRGITTGSRGQVPNSVFSGSRGTVASPLTTQAGDYLSSINLSGYVNGLDLSAVGLTAQWDPSANFTDAEPASNLYITTGGGSTFNVLSFNYKGVLNAPIFKATSYATGSYPTSPEKGWIIFDSTVNHFFGYNGTSWQQFA